MRAILVLFALVSFNPALAATYEAPDSARMEPALMLCQGVPDFPRGLEVTTVREQVAGNLETGFSVVMLQNQVEMIYLYLRPPTRKDLLEGTIATVSLDDWKRKTSKTICTVKKWRK